MNERIKALNGVALTVKLLGEEYPVVLVVDNYQSGKAPAIMLEDTDGELFCTLTCNIPGTRLEENEVLIKTWSENEEIAASILASGLLKDTGKRVPTGFVQAQIWEAL